MRPCLEVGCPRLVRSGRCAEHRRARARGGHRWVYADPRWQETRRRAIVRAGGRCQAVEHGRRCTGRVALHGHHAYDGGVEQLLADGGDPFDDRHVVVLCGSHHSRVEAWERAQRRRNAGFRR